MRLQRQSRNRTAGSSKRRVEGKPIRGVVEDEEGGMGGIRKSDQARQEGEWNVNVCGPSIKETRDETSMQEIEPSN